MVAAKLWGFGKLRAHAACSLAVILFGFGAGRVVADCHLGCDVLVLYNWSAAGNLQHFSQTTPAAFQFYSMNPISANFTTLKPSRRQDTDCVALCWIPNQYGDDDLNPVTGTCNFTNSVDVQIYTKCEAPAP